MSANPTDFKSRTKNLAFDLAAVVVVPIVLVLLWRAQFWTMPYTPDAEFSLSLGLFGSEITDRVDPTEIGYYWTRVGSIGPVHAFTSAFGWHTGVVVWRAVLLVLTVLPFYVLLKPRLGRILATAAVAIVATNTVILVAVGDVYPVSASVAAFSLLGGFGLVAVTAESRKVRVWSAFVAGLAAGWLPMINLVNGPPMAVAAVIVAVAMIAVHRKTALLLIAVAVGGTAASLIVFQVVAKLMFPALSWWRATYDGITKTPWTYFHQTDLNWLWTNPTLLVLPIALAVGLVGLGLKPKLRIELRIAFWLLTGTVFIVTVQQLAPGGTFLQLPYYYSALWPLALLVLATALLPVAQSRPQRWVALGLACILLPLAGYSSVTFLLSPWGLALALISLAFAGCALWLGWRDSARMVAVALSMLSIGVLQIIQNGLDPTITGLVIGRQSPSQVFSGVSRYDMYSVAVQGEEWVLANTTSDDKLFAWATPGRPGEMLMAMSVARVGIMPIETTMNPKRIPLLTTYKPTNLVLTGKDLNAVKTFYESIPQAVGNPQIRTCEVFTSGDVTTTACLINFTWKSGKKPAN